MAGIKVDISDALQSVLRTEEVLRNPRPFLELISEELRLVSRHAFERESSPDGARWLPLSLRYAKRKLKLGKGNQGILRFRGQLFRSIRSGVEGTTAFISTGNLKHSRIHQLGGNAGRGRKAKIPARPYMGFPPDSQARVVRDIEEELANRFKGK